MKPGEQEPRGAREAEHERVLAGDAREEVAAAAHERDVALAQVTEARRALVLAEGASRELAERVATLSARLAERDAECGAAAEEVRVAFEVMRVGAEEMQASSHALMRVNAGLEQRLAEQAVELADTAARLRAVTEAAPGLTWSSGPEGDWTWASRRWETFTGVPGAEACGAGWLRSIHPDDRERTVAAWAGAEVTGELRVEHRIRRADGAWRWFSTRALPVGDRNPGRRETGNPAGAQWGGAEWFGTSTDVDEARHTADALRDSEARFRSFAEATPDVFWIADARTGSIAYLSPAFEQVWGEGRERAPGREAGRDAGRDAGREGGDGEGERWMEALHPDDRACALALHEGALAGTRNDGEYRIRRPSDGAVRWIRDVAFPVHGAGGEVRFAAGVARDVTDRKDAEERQGLLMRELDHRVKNALAVVQSLAAQTARTTSTPHAFASAFTDRLCAFGRAQDLLTRENGRGALLSEVVEATLAPHGNGPRISREGPLVRLSRAATISLQMAFHELATNAVRHGALSVPGGRVRVTWRADPAAGPGGGLAIEWEERGGPPLGARPSRGGFGTRLIEQAVPRQLGGEVRLEFPAVGLRCRMRLPLTAQICLENKYPEGYR